MKLSSSFDVMTKIKPFNFKINDLLAELPGSILSGPFFPYLKNIVAAASGICDGLR